jgi:serine phosphatase RsbU (regulator of sigma subunit)
MRASPRAQPPIFVESELKTARQIQSVVVREETPSVPGFAISSLYGAAREVGGGLFQVIPGNSGDVLILLADLSGKGLKAAMMTPSRCWLSNPYPWSSWCR